MRTICSLLDLNKIKYEKIDVNVFQQAPDANLKLPEPNEPGFNPSGYNDPTLSENGETIIADAPTLYKYLCLTQRKDESGSTGSIDEQFYPRKPLNAIRKRSIDTFLDWIELTVRRNSSRVTKLIFQGLTQIATKGNGQQIDDDLDFGESGEGLEMIEEEKAMFFDVIIQNLEKQISTANKNPATPLAMYEGQPFSQIIESIKKDRQKNQQAAQAPSNVSNLYIFGTENSIADIAMFNEIQNVLGMLRIWDVANSLSSAEISQNIDPDSTLHILDYKHALQLKYPCVASWMNTLESFPAIRSYQVQFETEYQNDFLAILGE